MVHYIRIARCPYCNALTDYSNTTKDQLVGNPMRVCRKCKKTYYDFAYQEDALYYYFRIVPDKSELSLKSIFQRGEKAEAAAKKRAEQFFAKEETQNSPVALSLRRLSSPDYLEFLTDHYIEVPDYFFKRIGYVPKLTFAEKIKLKEQKDKADLDKLKQEQEKFKNAAHFLARGPRDKTFQTVAKEAGMTVEEFKAYCQKVVDNYDVIHREYNKTHMPPAQYPEI